VEGYQTWPIRPPGIRSRRMEKNVEHGGVILKGETDLKTKIKVNCS